MRQHDEGYLGNNLMSLKVVEITPATFAALAPGRYVSCARRKKGHHSGM